MPRPWFRRFSVQLGIAAVAATSLCGALVMRAQAPSREGPKAELRDQLRDLQNGLGARGRARLAQRLVEACRDGEPTADCLKLALRIALDLDRGADALGFAEALSLRTDSTEWYGMRAEALVRSARADEALVLVSAMGTKAEDDPFVQYALAHIAYFSLRYPAAKVHLERAIALGRGSSAHTLRTLVAFQEGELDVARDESERALHLDPESSEVIYNLALVSQRQDRYREAREGYLRALRLDPNHADSRYNLALLTHAAGASAEARHNLEKLRGIVGSQDPRVQNLDQMLGPASPAALRQTQEGPREPRTGP